MAAANATSRTILTTPKMPFSSGTQIALRSPVITPSWSVKMLQVTTDTRNASPGMSPVSSEYVGPQWLTVSRNGMVTTMEASALKA